MNKRGLQKAADTEAKRNGFDWAKFIGDRDGLSVYLASWEHPEDKTTGLPCFILVDPDGNAATEIGFKYMDMVKE